MPQVVCTRPHPDRTVLRVPSLREAERVTGVNRKSIVRRIISGRPSEEGWFFDWGDDPGDEGALIESRFTARRLDENCRRRERRRPSWESMLRRMI